MKYSTTQGIPEADLPVKKPSGAANIRYEENGKSYKSAMPDVVAASAIVQQEIDGIIADGEERLNQLVADAQSDIDAIVGGMGYLPPVAFASGLNVDSSRFTVTYDGVTYAPVADAIPFTTTGTFDPGQWRLVQGVSGADLAAVSGAAMIGTSGGISVESALRRRVVRANNVSAMKAMSGLSVGDEVRTAGYYAAGDGGNAHYEIVAGGTGVDDGGSFIDLPATGLQAKLIPSGLCVYVEQFGAVAVYNPDNPNEYNGLAAANTVAFQKAVDFARDQKVCTVLARGRGYVLNNVVVHEGVTLEGSTMYYGDATSARSPTTVLFQPEGYTEKPLMQLYDDTYSWDQWGATVRNFTLVRTGSLTAGTLFEARRGARALIENIDMIGGGDGMVLDGLQDSTLIRIRRVSGGTGVRMISTQPNTLCNALHFYDLWIEANAGRALEIEGNSDTALANAIEIFGLKLEGRPPSTGAQELVYLKHVMGIQIYGIAMIGAGSSSLHSNFSPIRMSGRCTGVIIDIIGGNNNYAGALKTLVDLNLTSTENEGIHVRMHGKITGSGTLGSLVNYGAQASGHYMPLSSCIDCSGMELQSGILTAVAAGTYSYFNHGNRVILKESVYGTDAHRPHPMNTNNAAQRFVSPNGSNWWEFRPSNSSMVCYGTGGEAFFITPAGAMRLREAELNFPIKLPSGTMTRRTKQNLVDNSPSAASFMGGYVLVTDASPVQFAYSDGTNWRWVKTLQIVSTSNDPPAS